MREWLKTETLSLKLIGGELQVDRNSLRRGRDGKPVARSTQKKLLLLFRVIKRGVSLNEALRAMKLKQVV